MNSMSLLYMSENYTRNHFLNTDRIRMQMMKSKDESSIGQQAHPH